VSSVCTSIHPSSSIQLISLFVPSRIAQSSNYLVRSPLLALFLSEYLFESLPLLRKIAATIHSLSLSNYRPVLFQFSQICMTGILSCFTKRAKRGVILFNLYSFNHTKRTTLVLFQKLVLNIKLQQTRTSHCVVL